MDPRYSEDSGEILVLYIQAIGSGILLLALIAYAIWLLFFKNKGNTEGEKCSKQDDCAAEHYCGGDNQCHMGVNGKDEGATCANSGDCKLGLKCKSKKCIKAT